MSAQIVLGRIECCKCGGMLQMYASTPDSMRQQFKRVAEILETHWVNNCEVPTNPKDYLSTSTPMTDRKDEAKG